jgi:hypothetical protein
MFEESLENLDNPKYLGSPNVVDTLVREFVRDCMDPTNRDESRLSVVVTRYATILSGSNRDWTAPEGRMTRQSLGRDLAISYRIDVRQALINIVRCALAEMASDPFEALAAAGGDHEAMRPVVDREVEKMVMTILGAGQVVAEGPRTA